MPIGLNLAKAKDIHKDNIRAARQPLLEKLDVDFVRTLEQGKKPRPSLSKSKRSVMPPLPPRSQLPALPMS